MGTKSEKGCSKKIPTKEVKKKRILVCRVGQTCSSCGKEGAIIRRASENSLLFRRGMFPVYGAELGAFLPLECSSCGVRYDEKEEKKVPVCRIGQNCPVCKAASSIKKRDSGNHISLGDGMAPLGHLRADAFFPLECTSCNTRFKKARETIFSRLRKILA